MANDEYVLVVNQQNTSSNTVAANMIIGKETLKSWKMKQGVGIMNDKGFKIEKKAGNIGPEIKCPSFCIRRMPNEPGQCSPVQRGKMAKDRIHVERTIN